MGCYSSRIYVIDPSEKVHLNPIVPGVPEENSSQVKAVHKQSQGQGPDNTEVLVGGTRHVYNQFGQLRPARAEKSCIVCSVFKRPPQTVYELNRALEPERDPRVCAGPRESTVRASPSPSAHRHRYTLTSAKLLHLPHHPHLSRQSPTWLSAGCKLFGRKKIARGASTSAGAGRLSTGAKVAVAPRPADQLLVALVRVCPVVVCNLPKSQGRIRRPEKTARKLRTYQRRTRTRTRNPVLTTRTSTDKAAAAAASASSTLSL